MVLAVEWAQGRRSHINQTAWQLGLIACVAASPLVAVVTGRWLGRGRS
jgi:hypothetical protein